MFQKHIHSFIQAATQSSSSIFQPVFFLSSMDVQDQITHATSLPSGHEGHAVHLCHRCGWPFPNPHPSSKQRRSHKRHCGTIEGYPVLIGAEAVSDEDHHADTDKEKSPSPKIEKKTSIGGSDGGDGLRASISRSEDEFFSDARTEFPESGTSQGGPVIKTFEKDLFYSFNDAGNGGTNEVLSVPIAVSKVDASLEVTEKPVTDAEKIGETEITTVPTLSESKLELTDTDEKCADGLIKDEVVDPTPEQIHVSQSQVAETIEAVKVAEEKVEESQTSEIVTEEAKDSEVTKTTPDVSLIVGQDADKVKQEVCEKIESEAKESEVNIDKIELDHEVAPEVVKESEIKPAVEGVIEEIKIEKIESDRELVPEKVSETDKKVPASIEKEDLGEHIQEVVNKLDTVLTDKSDVDAPESVKCSEEQIQEVVKELGTVLNEKENPDAAEFVKFLKDQVHDDAVKEPETVVTEKENLEEPKLEKQSNECTQEVLVDPDSIWTEKPDLDAPVVEKTLKENSPEETVLKSDLVLTEKEDLDGPQLEKCAKENAHEVIEQKVDNESNVVGLVADVTAEKITPNASGVAPEQMSVDSSSLNSVDGNWGSVLSTASVDVESTEKPKVNPTKPVTAGCLVEPEVKDSKPEPNSEDLTKVNNDSEEKKSTPLKNLLGEAKSPSAKKTDHEAKKDEAMNDKEGDPMSPPKLIEDSNKERKKVKGVRSWIPFGCCSSVNVVN